ncbi:MAG TPA: glutamine--fructose-6-phosphate aminotransferase, partial [Chloroflexota bacterium]|nr:glutamine--fructose-6-phosphate aminotransferase [Chloroflexota bacterium]
MCGIVGYVGSRTAVPVLMDGLKRLEYRGYDSAGIATLEDGQIRVHRRAGKLRELEDSLRGQEFGGTIGLGHTRWATHGRPNEINAHPQRDSSGQVVVVHNGIVENYREIRDRLLGLGFEFRSET